MFSHSGNCFTFNSVLNDQDEYAGTRRSSMTGPQFGLTLVLNVEQGEYMTGGQTQTVSKSFYMVPQ